MNWNEKRKLEMRIEALEKEIADLRESMFAAYMFGRESVKDGDKVTMLDGSTATIIKGNKTCS